MAPYPDSTPTETSSPEPVATHETEDSALPGMKRGIAIGVACSVGIIMIALVAFFAYRRRKQQATKTKHTKLSPEEPVEMDAGTGFWPREKKAPHEVAKPIEAESHTIHELDGSEVPELPGNYEGPELATKKTPRISYYAGDEDAFDANVKQWSHWEAAISADHARHTQDPTRDSIAYLEVSPTRQATSVSPVSEAIFYPPTQHASFSVSPIAPSPLESAHFTPPRTGQMQQKRYYDETRLPR